MTTVQLARNCQTQFYLCWRTWYVCLSEHPDNAVQFSAAVTFGKPFGILYFQLRVKWLHALLECTVFISLMPQMGGGKNTHGSLVIVEHVWNPVCTDFSFTQAVGEDIMSICWRNSVCRNNCRAWHTERTFKNRFYFLCGLHPSPILGLHWEGHRPSWPSPISKQCRMKKLVSLHLSFKDL